MTKVRGFAVGTLEAAPGKIVVIDCQTHVKTELNLIEAAIFLEALSLAVTELHQNTSPDELAAMLGHAPAPPTLPPNVVKFERRERA